MDGAWGAGSIRLKFLLGEMPLFTVAFPALILDAHFSTLAADPLEPRPPFERLAPGLELLLARSHPVAAELPRLALAPRSLRYVPAQYRRHYIELDGTFADYLGKFSAKSRSTLGRKVRKFAEFCGGEIRWREHRSREELAAFYQLARSVSQTTYQERLLNAGLPRDERFREEMLALAGRDAARGYLLFHRERPVAYLYCPARGEVLLYRHLGYDPEFARWSPGTVLQYIVLERLFAEGRFRLFDFTEGEGPHKEFFATGSTRCADVYYFRRTFRNLFLLGLHAGLDALSRAGVGALDALGLKARLKKLLRSRA